MSKLRFGIVGSGMIAGVIANAIKKTDNTEVVAVASRTPTNAKAFAETHGITQVFNDWQQMIESDLIDAVYIATPTAVREEVAIAAAQAKKHILGEKPFASYASLQRITQATKENQVAFMDATHFAHHPRTKQIQRTQEEQIGASQAVRSTFFFPLMQRDNIRFDTEQEPTGAVGDMAWYCMRAITEYLQTNLDICKVDGSIVRDEETNAVIRGTGVIAFSDGKSSTFDFGYNAGVCLMDLDILAERGMFRMDDFVLDWNKGFAFDNPEHRVGYTKRSEMQTPTQYEYVDEPSELAQEVHMMNNFFTLCQAPTSDAAENSRLISERTQYLLDMYWKAVS